jgi:two-component sensor histidine kinase
MFGILLDVTERKQADEAREMLASEMSHRVKNLFAIASSLTAISARSAATTTDMARDLIQRLGALAGAHDLIRLDLGQGGHKAALLSDLFAVFLAPYDNRGIVGHRIRVSLPEVRVGETSATTLALIVHELATNSVNYGLSRSRAARSTCRASTKEELAIVRAERDGPPVSAPTGFGGSGASWLPGAQVVSLTGPSRSTGYSRVSW